jgi:hypothetical protein
MAESASLPNGGFPLLEDLNVDNDKPVELKRREFSSSKGVVSLKSLIESRKAQNLTFYKPSDDKETVIKLSQRRLSLTPDSDDEKPKKNGTKSKEPNAAVIKSRSIKREKISKKSTKTRSKTHKRSNKKHRKQTRK